MAGGTWEYVTYLPERWCVLGQAIRVRDEGRWDGGWVVAWVSTLRVEKPLDLHRSLRGHRRRTGDALPKR